MQRIGERKAGGDIAGFLANGVFLRQAARAPFGFRELTVKVIKVTQLFRGDIGEGAVIGVLLLAVADTGHQLMLASKQLKGAAGERIHGIHFTLTGVVAGAAHDRITGVRRDARAGGFIEITVDIHLFAVDQRFVMRAVQRHHPAVIKGLFEGGEQFFAFFIVVGPVRRGVKPATVICFAAVNVPARHSAPGRAVGVGLLEFVTGGEQGGIGHVGIYGGIDELFGCAVTFDVAVIVLITGDQTATHVARFTQWRGQIGNIALFVPAAVGGGNVAGEFFAVGVFTHHVYRRGRVTRPGHQTGCAAHHFDTFVQRGVRFGIAQVPARLKHRRDTVGHVVVDEKTARVIRAAIHIRDVLRNAGGVIEYLTERLQLLILHTLCADDADRLRNIALRQQHFGACGGDRHAVILRGAAGVVARLTGDNHGIVGGFRRGGWCSLHGMDRRGNKNGNNGKRKFPA